MDVEPHSDPIQLTQGEAAEPLSNRVQPNNLHSFFYQPSQKFSSSFCLQRSIDTKWPTLWIAVLTKFLPIASRWAPPNRPSSPTEGRLALVLTWSALQSGRGGGSRGNRGGNRGQRRERQDYPRDGVRKVRIALEPTLETAHLTASLARRPNRLNPLLSPPRTRSLPVTSDVDAAKYIATRARCLGPRPRGKQSSLNPS